MKKMGQILRSFISPASWLWLLSSLLLPAFAGYAQSNPAALFEKEDLLHLKLSGKIRTLFNDRSDAAQYHPLVLTYKGADSNEVSVPLKAKTRGNFRRKRENCLYPPLLLNFQKASSKASLFEAQDKLKLVMPCRDDQYVVREYLVYKLYNLLTPKSFRARLAQLAFFDTDRNKETTLYGLLLEEDEQMAGRNGVKLQKRKMLRGESTETETFLKMAVFQYMIGNTDWSVPYLHNTRIVAFDSLSIPSVVPYDFDHAGIVAAPYALPAEQLALRSTQERRFRGYCITDMKTFDAVVATFNRLKESFYNVYRNCPYLEARYVNSTVKFLDQFYETLNNPKKLKTEFSYPCRTDLPNVVIQGLSNE